MQKKLSHLLIFALITWLLLILAPSAASQGSSGTSPQCSTPPGSIWVFLQNFLSEWPFGTNAYQNPAMEDYTYGVVMGELGPSVPQGPYVGQAWDDDVLRAQSVAARTWGSYWCRKRALGNGQLGVYDGALD
jgi:hypothetical protein